MLPETTAKRIVDALRPLAPEKVILFGSYAWGVPGRDSDLDLYVVTSEEGLPASFRERNAIYLQYALALEDLYKEIPIDLIVHTKAMHRKFVEQGSMFCRRVMESGVSLL